METLADVCGVILAGGESRRFGRDKRAAQLAGRSLIEHVIERFRPQVGRLVVATGADASWASALDVDTVADPLPRRGPLSGLLAGLEWAARAQPDLAWIATAPCDCPFLPRDLVREMREALNASPGAEVAIAASSNRLHPTLCIVPTRIGAELRTLLEESADLSMRGFLGHYRTIKVHFPETDGEDSFLNINTADQLAAAEDCLRMRAIKLPPSGVLQAR